VQLSGTNGLADLLFFVAICFFRMNCGFRGGISAATFSGWLCITLRWLLRLRSRGNLPQKRRHHLRQGGAPTPISIAFQDRAHSWGETVERPQCCRGWTAVPLIKSGNPGLARTREDCHHMRAAVPDRWIANAKRTVRRQALVHRYTFFGNNSTILRTRCSLAVICRPFSIGDVPGRSGIVGVCRPGRCHWGRRCRQPMRLFTTQRCPSWQWRSG